MAATGLRYIIPAAALATFMAAATAALQAAAPVLPAPKPAQAGKSTGTPAPVVPLPGTPEPRTPAHKKPPAAKPDLDHGHGRGKDSVIETVDLPVLPVLMRTSRSSWDNGYGNIRKTILALQKEAARAGLQPKGRPMIVYIESNDRSFRFDALLPLASKPENPPTLSNGFRLATTPGGKAMTFEHRGPYADIEKTYEAITAYLDEKSLRAREFFIEEIVNDIADPKDIKMAVNIYVFLQ